MTAALRTAGCRALAQLAMQGYEPDRVILDGNHDYLRMGARVTTVIKGDATSLAVAAASCVAKVARDALMADESEHFPAYGFESNRGYPAPVHKAALNAHGPTTIHRRSWIFMDNLVLGRPRPAARPPLLTEPSAANAWPAPRRVRCAAPRPASRSAAPASWWCASCPATRARPRPGPSTASSGASMMLRKSHCPISAYCATTVSPIDSTSRVTSCSRSGFSRNVAQPPGPSVLNIA